MMVEQGLLCVYSDNDFRVAHRCQAAQGYEQQGLTIAKFLRNIHNKDRLLEGLKHIHEASADDLRRANARFTRLNASEEIMWRLIRAYPESDEMFFAMELIQPSLSVDMGVSILYTLVWGSEFRPIPLRRNLEFANDCPNCEWAYVINLDQETLEIFHHWEDKRSGHRFNDVGMQGEKVPAHFRSITFSNLGQMTEVELQQWLAEVDTWNAVDVGSVS
jgi:hypothetical protein